MNSKQHQEISFCKSFVRVVGFITLGLHFWVGIALLIGAELLGIIEEL